MYKAVLQVPTEAVDDEALLALRWQETEDPHGPHIKVYRDKVDAETGESCVFIRCKHRSIDQLNTLIAQVSQGIKDAESA